MLRQAAATVAATSDQPDWAARAIDYDLAFHRVVAQASGNERLAADIGRYRLLVQGLCRMTGTIANLRAAFDEHMAILSALEAAATRSRRCAAMAASRPTAHAACFGRDGLDSCRPGGIAIRQLSMVFLECGIRTWQPSAGSKSSDTCRGERLCSCLGRRSSFVRRPERPKRHAQKDRAHCRRSRRPPATTHEYCRSRSGYLRRCLATSTVAPQIVVETHFGGWPEDESTLSDADTIVLITSGSDHVETNHPLLVGNRLLTVEKQMQRGCGLLPLHYSTFAPNPIGPRILDWVGGYFDYQGGPDNKWFSKIQHWDADLKPAAADHPICRGVRPFRLREELYYNLRFIEDDPRRTPILVTRPPNESADHAVAWAVERKDGGRGFGFTGGHHFENWLNDDFRRLVLNAIAWTAHVEVPVGGSRFAAWPAARKGPGRDCHRSSISGPCLARDDPGTGGGSPQRSAAIGRNRHRCRVSRRARVAPLGPGRAELLQLGKARPE